MPETNDSPLVLVVDDDPMVLRSIERLLRRYFRVLGYVAARDALARIHAGGIDVVVTDMSMPGMSGLELLRAIHAHAAALPVVLVTATGPPGGAAEAVKEGFFAYVAKPFESSELLGAVRDALSSAQPASVQRLRAAGRAKSAS